MDGIKYWRDFENSGTINDYLGYRNIISNSDIEDVYSEACSQEGMYTGGNLSERFCNSNRDGAACIAHR